jgi:hypothetical protein
LNSFKILHYWCFKKVPLGSGLTIPFLIGVDYLNDRVIPDSTYNKLTELNNTNLTSLISIHFCSNIQEYVVQLNDNSDKPSLAYYKKIGQIHVTGESLEIYTSLTELSSFFDLLYMEHIRKTHFSKNFGKWTVFNEDEIRMIKQLYSTVD